MQAAEEVSGGFFVARRDGSELFDVIEEALDQVALGIEREVAVAFDRTIRFRRDDGLDRAHFQAFDEAVGVIAFVREEGLRPHLGGEGLGLIDVVDLPAGEAERQGIAQGVDDHMDFGGQPAARTSYGLVEAPFLRAPALC